MQHRDSSEHKQRIRIGLTGLAFVFVLVILGTAVSRSGGGAKPGQTQANGVANSAEPEEPLAQIGVAPGQSTTPNEVSEQAPAP